MAVDSIERKLDGSGLRIGVVVSRFNDYAGKELWAACHDELNKLGVADEDIVHMTVPGALEIPLALQRLAASEAYDALIALGAVIKGETYHFELVANESAAGISRVTLDFGIPVANGVLTTYTDEQCHARTEQKGRDCAQCAVEMVNTLEQLPDADEDLQDDFDFDVEDK